MIKKLLRRLLRINKPNTVADKIQNWRKNGITIGDGCHIYSELPSGRDCFLLELKNNVTISGNVTFLLHDASVGTITNSKYTDALGKIVIGNNCFIGYGSIILPGVELGDNTIVGAGSIVTKSSPGDVVICGNPAKIICSVNDYLSKNSDYFVQLDGMSKEDIMALIDKNSQKLINKGSLK